MPFTKLNNISVHYKIQGEGTPLIFLHGISDSSDYWIPMIKHFSSEYQVIAPDLRGHGLSSKDVDIDIDLFTGDLDGIVNKFDLQEFIIAGFSLGSLIALNYTLKFPDKIKAMILCSGYSKATPKICQNLEYLENLTANEGVSGFFDEMIEMVYTKEFLSKHTEYYDFKESAIEMNHEQAIIQSLKVCEEYDVKNRLKEIDIPSLIICGCVDDLIPPSSSIDLNNNLAVSNLIKLSNMGHNILLPETVPKIIFEITGFLDTI